ncbi:MAG: PAS domain S-box protein [Methanomicrobiaceae archaeon]|nr:PAS domain S-box protein [Methanomicrobiaceae archaeon]
MPPDRLLYIDDEPALLEICKLFLEKAGDFSVDTAPSAMEGLSMIESGLYDAVISDYQMPDIDGIELLKRIRAAGNTIPFIIFTGRGREQVVIEALNSGADFYLQKGGDPRAQFTELANLVRQSLKRYRVEIALIESEQRYRDVVEDQTELISRFLPDGTHVFVNEAYCKYFGRSREDILGKKFTPDSPPDDLRDVRILIDSLTPEHPVGKMDQRVIMPDGTVRWQRWIDRAIFDEKGTLIEFQSVGRDISETKEVETALRKSEKMLSDIINFLPDPTFAIDREGRVIAWNHAIEEMTGVAAADMLGKGNHEYTIPFFGERRKILIDLIFAPEEEILKLQYHNIIRREGKLLIADTSLPHLHGKKAVLWGKAAPLFNENGEMFGAIESIRDLTGRREAEEKAGLLASFIETSPAAITIHDTDGYFLYTNQKNLDLHGYTREEFFALNLHDLDVPKDTELYDQRIRDLMEEGEATFEVSHVRKDGTILPLQVVAKRIRWSDRDVVMSIATDITERKRSEEALRESEERYRSLMEQSFEGVVIHQQGRVIFINETAREMLGAVNNEKYIGKPVLDCVHPDSREDVKERIRSLNDSLNQIVPPLEEKFIRLDGTVFDVEVIATKYFFEGEPAIQVAFRDISERIQAEKELREANRQLYLLNSVTRHDMANQLLALTGYVKLARETEDDPVAVKDYLGKIYSAAEALSRQIEFTKAYQNLGVVKPFWQSIERYCTQTTGKTNISCECRGIEIFADPMLQNVFANLIENSHRHGERVTRINIECHENPEGLSLVYEDDGTGIPEEKKEMIFKRGYGRNTGFGLFIAREILGFTGMTICETGEPGVGARFEITVPKGVYRYGGQS